MLPVTSSELSTELAASSLEPTAPAVIFAAVTEFAAILGSVTALAAICIVSMLPETSSELSTEFAASSEAPTAPAAICDASITSVPILLAFIALSAILDACTALTASFAAVTCASAICIVSIEPDTSSAVSTEFAPN